ncbi:MAG: glucose-6-phosphate dehydrogenase [Dehalococcoidia bacterium]
MTTATPSGRKPKRNPLREGQRQQRTAPPVTMIIFGASGDLTKRKLVPALYNLQLERQLAPEFTAIGVSRTEENDENFRTSMREGVDEFSRTGKAKPAIWNSFAQGLYYIPGDTKDPKTFTMLKAELEKLDKERGTQGNRIFYLSTPPGIFGEIIEGLGTSGLAKEEGGFSRIIIEKPFGRDYDSAVDLDSQLAKHFRESQIYRIDHYLGKETVQNLLVLRFANGIFEPIWNRQYIDHVQVTVAESIGIEGRGGYYESSGALRDMLQNHLMQLMTLVAMEAPASIDANGVRDEKVKVLRSIRPLCNGKKVPDVVRGQYGPGWVEGKQAPGYREETGVKPDSATETYVAARLFVDNWRWAGVPFYLRTGKRLPRRVSEIAVQFNQAPHLAFAGQAITEFRPNVLSLRIQPDEGMSLTIGAKVPGSAMRIRSVNMDFSYGSSFLIEPPEAYERLLLDCMAGDQTLFKRRDEVEEGWKTFDCVLDAWAQQDEQPDFPSYEAGTWGPRDADRLIERDGRRWRTP